MLKILEPQIKGFKYLFFVQKGEIEKFSLIKTTIFLVYLFSMIFAFLQFSTNHEFTIKERSGENGEDISYWIVPNIYGELFYILTFILFFLALLIIIINKLRNFNLKLSNMLSLTLWILILFIFTMLTLSFFVDNEVFFEAFNDLTYGLVIIWLLFIEPVLFFRSLILILEIISEDYEFKGYTKNIKEFILFNYIILLVIGFIIYWMEISYENATDYTLISGIVIIYDNLSVLLAGVFLLLFITSIFLIYFLWKGKKSNQDESYNYKKSIIPFVTFYGILFLFIRGIPGGFIWDNTLRSITNLLDISFLVIIIIIGINGLVNLPDSVQFSNSFHFSRPLTWLSNIPKYSKILFLFFLGSQIFYNHLEAETIAVLTKTPNSLATTKVAAVASIVIIGFISVFLNFKPNKMPEGHIGPIKFGLSSLDKMLKKGRN